MVGGAAIVFAVPPVRDAANLDLPGSDYLALALGSALVGGVGIELVGRVRGSRFVTGDEAAYADEALTGDTDPVPRT